MCKCPEGYAGNDCEITPCTTDPCLNGGTCSINGGTYVCACTDGFIGSNCQITPCSVEPCQNEGVCDISGSSYICICPDGYSGENCEITPCSVYPCINGGICSIDGSSFKCDCESGYSGDVCEITPCSGDPCQNGGTCSIDGSSFICYCENGFSGLSCEISTTTTTTTTTATTTEDPCKDCNTQCYPTPPPLIEHDDESDFGMHMPSANHETESPSYSEADVPSNNFFGFNHKDQWYCLSRYSSYCQGYLEDRLRSPKIIAENNELEIKIFPWSILFTDSKQTKGICSGVLISSRNILTSGLCSRKIFAGLSSADAAVGGITDFDNDERENWVVRVLERRYYHPGYK